MSADSDFHCGGLHPLGFHGETERTGLRCAACYCRSCTAEELHLRVLERHLVAYRPHHHRRAVAIVAHHIVDVVPSFGGIDPHTQTYGVHSTLIAQEFHQLHLVAIGIIEFVFFYFEFGNPAPNAPLATTGSLSRHTASKLPLTPYSLVTHLYGNVLPR